MMRSDQSALLATLKDRRPERPPVWFIRQVGRSLSGYRDTRQSIAILDICLNPELATEITCQLAYRHGVNAAVLFPDIMTPLALAGIEVTITAGVGPVFEQPVNSVTEVNRLVEHQILDISVMEKVMALVITESDEDMPVIGFVDTSFTSVAYLVEGRGFRDHLGARTFMHAEPVAWDQLLNWCADLPGGFLRIQVATGARAVQLFDSWAGTPYLADYTTRVTPYSRRALENAPVSCIHSGTRTGHLLEVMAGCGSKVTGINRRIPPDEVARRLPGKVLQGNIDPARLVAGWENLATYTRDVVERGRSAPAYVVNLEHGVPPETDPVILTDLVTLAYELWGP